MQKINSVTITSKTQKFYKKLLLLYPQKYRRRFGNEILDTFNQIYHNELAENDKITVRFWFNQLSDIIRSVVEQHIDDIQKKGMKKYLRDTLHVNRFNVIGIILLTPFLTILVTDFISRILQGNLTHYNRPVYHFISQTPLYSFPVFFTMLVMFPAAAILLNLVSILQSLRKKKFALISIKFVFLNFATLLIVAVGGGVILLVFGHDVIPCIVHGLFLKGPFNMLQILQVCRNA